MFVLLLSLNKMSGFLKKKEYYPWLTPFFFIFCLYLYDNSCGFFHLSFYLQEGNNILEHLGPTIFSASKKS